MTPFKCVYELDQRVDADLVRLNQELYRESPQLLAGHTDLPLDENGLPDAVHYYLVYVSALIYGAADAALTLVLHNLGREARFFQRQIFECLIRASNYAENPDEAKLALVSTAFQEMALLDQLGYDRTSERYSRLRQFSESVADVFSEARFYRELNLKSLLREDGNENLVRLYALNYRATSLMAHASFNGAGGIITEDGVSFDSRESLPNYIIANITVYLLAFIELLDSKLSLRFDERLGEYRSRWVALQRVAVA